jgi:PIN domain nuclease of toxin-antitoxin system
MYIIDTHILLWALMDTSKLSQREKEILSDPESEILVSVASIWEIAIKLSLKKLKIPDNFPLKIREIGFNILPIDFDAAWKVRELPSHHGDPFDRLIITTALQHDLILITHDKLFEQYGVKLLGA